VLDDEAIRAICDSLIMSHNLTIQKLLLNDTGCGNYGITTIIETMRCIHKLCTVEVENCKNISADSMAKLTTALRINQAREEKTQQINKMYDAGKARDKFDEMGIGYDKGGLLTMNEKTK
jgi:hypothetical protein